MTAADRAARCAHCGADVALDVDHESVAEVCSGCGREHAPAADPALRQQVRAIAYIVRRTRPLLAPKCTGRMHRLCRVSTCECWCHREVCGGAA